MDSKVIIVSNRLPISAKKENSDNCWKFEKSSGGLVTALSGLQEKTNFVWVGWLGTEIPQEDQCKLKSDMQEQFQAVPVFLPSLVADNFYNGFCNSVLWPLFHYLPGEINHDPKNWDAYIYANNLFAEAILQLDIKPGDIVWIHDYHLMILPRILRKSLGNDVKIGFFLHTPFPSSEVFRVLPTRRELLMGLADCNLIGFHSFDYLRHFSNAFFSLLPSKATTTGLVYQNHLVELAVFPIGIDPEKFSDAVNDPIIIKRLYELREQTKDKIVILGVDRLDYIKGIPNKLVGFQRFLEKYPDYAGKVILIQVAVPTRTDVQDYIELRDLTFELAGKCNGRFGNSDFAPLQLINNSVNFVELSALYQLADVCLITSIRDGMNLVAYEYVASQKRGLGCLVISEFAGAANSLSGSINVNPWDSDDLADKIYTAINSRSSDKADLAKRLGTFVTEHSAMIWGEYFLKKLEESRPSIEPKVVHLRPKYDLIVSNNFEQLQETEGLIAPKSHRVLVVDKEECIYPDLSIISKEPSGFKLHGTTEWINISDEKCEHDCKDHIHQVLESFATRTPGSKFIDDCNGMEWQFVFGDKEFWDLQINELHEIMEKFAARTSIQVLYSEASVRIQFLSKARLFSEFLSRYHQIDSILVISDEKFPAQLLSEFTVYSKMNNKNIEICKK